METPQYYAITGNIHNNKYDKRFMYDTQTNTYIFNGKRKKNIFIDFFEIQNINNHINRVNRDKYIWTVSIPLDVKHNNEKANHLILHKRYNIDEFVVEHKLYLKFPEMPHDVLLQLLRDEPKILDYISDPTKEMIFQTLARKPENIKTFFKIDELTDDELDKAIHISPKVLEFIPPNRQTFVMCEFAVGKNPSLLKYATIQNEKMCSNACKRRLDYFQYTKYPSLELCKQAVNHHAKNLQYVPIYFKDECDPNYVNPVEIMARQARSASLIGQHFRDTPFRGPRDILLLGDGKFAWI